MPSLNPIFTRIDLTGLATTAAVLGSAYAVGFHPLMAARSERRELQNRLTKMDLKVRQDQDEENQIHLALNELQTRISQGVHLSDRAQVNHTISLLTERAEDARLVVESGRADEPEDHSLFAIIAIHLSGKGGFVATTRFISTLADSFPDVELRSINVQSPTGSVQSTSEFTIELAWYVLPRRDD